MLNLAIYKKQFADDAFGRNSSYATQLKFLSDL